MAQFREGRGSVASALVLLAFGACSTSNTGGDHAAGGGTSNDAGDGGDASGSGGAATAGRAGASAIGHGGTSGSAGSGAALGTDGGTGAYADGGGSGSPDAGAGGDGSGELIHLGNLSVSEQQAQASFVQGTQGVGRVLQTFGPCLNGLFISESNVTTVSAGTLTITGGAEPLTLSLQHGGSDNSFLGYSTLSAAFSPGDTLEFSASGATVPPFSISLVFPEPIQFKKPVRPSHGPLMLSRATDLVVEWSGGNTGGIVSIVIASFTDSSAPDVECTFPQELGGAVIPAAALAQLPATPNPDSGTPDTQILASASSSTEIAVGVWKINASASSGNFSSNVIVR